MVKTFVCISDCHGRHRQLVIPPGDFLLHAGDFTSHDSVPQNIDFLKWLEEQPHQHKVFCAGNHNFLAQRNPDLFRSLVKAHAPSCHFLDDSEVDLEGFKIYGQAWTPFFLNWAYNAYRGSDIQYYRAKIALDASVLITHGPPDGVLDLVEDGTHQGCADLTDTINEMHLLKLNVFGHLHLQGCTQTKIDDITFVNAAVVGEDYRLRGQIQTVSLSP